MPGASLVRSFSGGSSSFSTAVATILSVAFADGVRAPSKRRIATSPILTAPLMTQAGKCFFTSRSCAVSAAVSSLRITAACVPFAAGRSWLLRSSFVSTRTAPSEGRRDRYGGPSPPSLVCQFPERVLRPVRLNLAFRSLVAAAGTKRSARAKVREARVPHRSRS